jgi:hypothetical protein
VKGSLSAMKILIRGGGEIETIDSTGYTTGIYFISKRFALRRDLFALNSNQINMIIAVN